MWQKDRNIEQVPFVQMIHQSRISCTNPGVGILIVSQDGVEEFSDSVRNKNHDLPEEVFSVLEHSSIH